MRNATRLFSPLVLVLLALAGCTSTATRKVIDLAPFKHVFVERRLTDDHHLDEIIVQELNHLGYEASSGPLTMLPEKSDAIVTYTDRWAWDFKTYWIDFKVEVRTARTSKKLADGDYNQPTLNPKSPEEVVRRVLEPLFKKK